ncbi:MAG: S8 family serine peptidase [Chloroflexi bacterium]|nr:S8 family serine peptidase [Chloroflexota bacterium]
MTEVTAGNEPYILDFVPDEVCIIVEAPFNLEGRQLYSDALRLLNTRLPQHIRSVAAEPGHPVAEDLTFSNLSERIDESGGNLFQRLGRGGIEADASAAQTDAGVRAPWVVFHRGDSAAAEWHLYYQVGPDRLDLLTSPIDRRHQRLASIRQLANLMNVRALGIGEDLGDQNWRVVGASPNWLTTAHDFSCAGPASLPAPETRTGRWRFHFADPIREALRSQPVNSDVVVAVLDTCPDLSHVQVNPDSYLEQVWHDVHSDAAQQYAMQRGYFDRPGGVDAYVGNCVAWWHENMPRDADSRQRFNMADHGLFASGIVHDIARDDGCEIRLIRVLNDYGVGDLLAIAHVLRALPENLLAERSSRGPKHLIVNLSLGAVPSQVKHRARWLPAVHRGLDASGSVTVPEAAQHLLDAAHLNLKGTIDWLHRQDVLVVASAGNDALRDFTRGHVPPPRYPARYEHVFGVSATSASGEAAIYANRADVSPLGNGIATFGGDAIKPQHPTEAANTETGTTRLGREQAVVGVFSSEKLPGGAINHTGWGQWAGTSFAAPVVSGLAARAWARMGSSSADQILAWTRSVASRSSATHALDAPVLEAWQVHEP